MNEDDCKDGNVASTGTASDDQILLCSACFSDPGLRRMAATNERVPGSCPNCNAVTPNLLTRGDLLDLCEAFFVRGSLQLGDFGGAPAIQFNNHQLGSLEPDDNLRRDVNLLQTKLKIGFFHYGPRLWMLGYIEPLDRLRDERTRSAEIARVIDLYPTTTLSTTDEFFRVRKAPDRPAEHSEYDAPPEGHHGTGRLDAPGRPVLYASQDVEVCVHECRFAVGDELYLATLRPSQPLKILDLSAVLLEEGTEFESVDLAVLMLFLAGPQGYAVSRDIAKAVANRGFDGLVYPSFFSVLRTGSVPFETVYGLSLRRLAATREYERSKVVPNIALFGRPICDGKVDVVGINRMVISQARYAITLGPVRY